MALPLSTRHSISGVSRRNLMQLDNEAIISLVFSRLDNSDFTALDTVSRDIHSLLERLRNDNHLHFLRVRHLCPHQSEIEHGDRQLNWRDVYDGLQLIKRNKWRPRITGDEAETALLLHLESGPRCFHRVLSIACMHGYASVVTAALPLWYCLNATERLLFFRLACGQSRLTVISVFLNSTGIDMTQTQAGEALRHACHHGLVEVVRVLLEDGRWDPASQIEACLHTAVFEGHATILQLLLEDGRANPDTYLLNYLCRLSDKGRVDMIRMLLSDPRSDPTQNGSWAMEYACKYGHIETVRALLEDGRADIIANDCIPKTWYAGHTDILRLLLADSRVSDETRESYDPNKVWSYNVRVSGIAAGLTCAVLGCAILAGAYSSWSRSK